MKNESGSTTDSESSVDADEGEDVKLSDQSAEEILAGMTSADGPAVKQKYWRWAGGMFLVMAGGMVMLAVNTHILRDSLIATALLFFDGTSDPSPAYPYFVYVLYWGVFIISLVLAGYMVMLDLRYIRLDYALTKRTIMKEAWEHEDFRKAIQEAHDEARESDE